MSTREERRKREDVARSMENLGRSLQGLPPLPSKRTVVALSIAAIVLTLANYVLAGAIIYWNITDIQNVGVNFWNVFWLVVAASMILGGFNARTRR